MGGSVIVVLYVGERATSAGSSVTWFALSALSVLVERALVSQRRVVMGDQCLNVSGNWEMQGRGKPMTKKPTWVDINAFFYTKRSRRQGSNSHYHAM
jgi:hypothetical protein